MHGISSKNLKLPIRLVLVVRELTIDVKKGNVLKMDQHKCAKVAFHGLKQLSFEHNSNLRDSSIVRESFDGRE